MHGSLDVEFAFAARTHSPEESLAVAWSPGFTGPPGFGAAVLREAAEPLDVNPREIIGYAILVVGPHVAIVQAVHVTASARRRGVASALYDAAERHWSVVIKPSPAQTKEGRALWRGMRRANADLRDFRRFSVRNWQKTTALC